MISVIDYGVANLGSMLNMLRKLNLESESIGTPEGVASATQILLPGIGAFDHGMTALAERGLVEPLRKRVTVDNVPILGVCLGMQMLGTGSEEGEMAGLGFLDAACRRFRNEDLAGLKVPHMGWAHISQCRKSRLLAGLEDTSRFYFVHSYHLVCNESADVLARARHGIDFVSVVEHANIFGVQFHPEKSHRFGMTLLRNFASLTC